MNIRSLLRHYCIRDEISAQVDRIKQPVGSFGYDAWGYHVDALKIGLSTLKFFYDNYFRVHTNGIDNIPATGRVLIIANHSGQVPLDGVLIGSALARREKDPRAARVMIERFFPTVPFIGNILNSIGGVVGDPINCSRMLDNEDAVIVFPEGIRGSSKLYDKRYQLQHFGSGFMRLAVQHNAPIVPVGVIGCEEAMPSFYNIKPLAEMLGLPYAPVTTPIPLPARISLYFGAPMSFDFDDARGEADVTHLVDTVKDQIRALINEGLSKRESIF